MGLFGPSKQERIERAIEGLQAASTSKDSTEYLRSHFTDAWPQLEAVLLSAPRLDPGAAALAAMQPWERDAIERLDRSLPYDLAAVSQALRQGGMPKEEVAALLPIIAAKRNPYGAQMRAAAVLRFCLPLIEQQAVGTAVTTAALALLVCETQTVSAAAAAALCAIGPGLLPDLVVALPKGGSRVEAAVRVVGQKYPHELTDLCRNATAKKDIVNWLLALQLVGKEARPAMGWVCEQMAGRAGVREAACSAALAIGPTGACIAPAEALLEKSPQAASELLIAARPQGVEALGRRLPALSDQAAGVVLAVLSKKGSAGHLACFGVAQLISDRPALVEAALATLERIGPTEACLDAVAAQLADHQEAATAVLARLGEKGTAALAAHRLPGYAARTGELSDADMATLLPLVLARKQDAGPFVARMAAMLAGRSEHAAAAMRGLGALGSLACPAAPQILAYFEKQPTDLAAAELAQIGDPSFTDTLAEYARRRAKRLGGERVKAEAAMVTLASLGAAARSAAGLILDYFKANASDKILIQMAQIADPSFFDPLIRYVFNTPRPSLGDLPNAMARFAATTSLSAEAIVHALRASGYDAKGDSVTFGRSDNALAKLIADPDPAVSNLLHLIVAKPDIRVVIEYSCGHPSAWGHVSVEAQREKARAGLAKRGNPPYDPALYRLGHR